MENARNHMSFLQEQTPVGDGGIPASHPPAKGLFGIADAVIIPALLGLAGSIFGALWSNKKADDRANDANKWSLEQWQRENAYNSPTNQMARLAAAGINPALAYTNGVNNSAATSPSVTSAVGTEKNPLAGIDPLTASQVRLNNAQASETESKIPVHKQEVLEIASKIKLNDSLCEEAKSAAARNEALSANAREELNHLIDKTQLLGRTFQARVESAIAEGQLKSKEASTFDTRFKREIDVLINQSKSLLASANLSAEQKRAVQSQIDLMVANRKYLNNLAAIGYKDWSNYELKMYWGYVNSSLNAAANVAGTVAGVKGAFAPVMSK